MTRCWKTHSDRLRINTRFNFSADDEEIRSQSNQSNSRDLENPRTWTSSSHLTIRFERTHHGKRIRCVALHPAYPAGSTASAAALDIRLETSYKD
ncbi:hypothetical protein J437_LFUL004622 [Ladona fulva]|uniref:Uncharacterized protein n=1 Tax=Ladona fulva TaxID=123851 RepID=A0A8K0JYB0_LADFU|nr:hypothetical protein J437_LFUL004622 [Ladona fulva]